MANSTPTEGKAASKEKILDDALADSFPASDPVAPAVPHRSVRSDEKHVAEHIVSRDRKETKE